MMARHLIALILIGGSAAPAAAQSTPRWRLVADNDYFNFWQAPARRPDVEYTQGLTISVALSGAPRLARSMRSGLAECGVRAPAATDETACWSTTLHVAQEIYTPWNDAPTWQPGQRPYAGWLALGATARATTFTREDALGLSVGVTGPASLASGVQTAFHRLAGFRTVLGWPDQLKTEPGIILSYGGGRAATVAVSRGTPLLVAGPYWRARLGNIATDASLGLRLHAGWNVPSLWSAGQTRRSGLSVFGIAGVRQDAVARNLFLDGNTFRAGPRVTKHSWVREVELGIGLRWHRVGVEWRTMHRQREYRTQPEPHRFSSIAVTL